jgi:2',3'-cyclic-nucleotide 2'-phosphodiesterase (5'-nucleotidase family)
MSEALATGFAFVQDEADYLQLLTTHAQQLRSEGAMAVVVLSELGLHKNWRIARDLPPGVVDVILSAHTHERTFSPVIADNGVWVAEAGDDAYVGRLDLDIVDGALVGRQWSILPVDHNLIPKASIAARIAELRAPFLTPPVNLTEPLSGQTLTRPISDIVGFVQEEWSRTNALDNQFNRVFAELLRQRTGSDLAMTKGFRFGATIPPAGAPIDGGDTSTGAITIEDVYQFFPAIFTFATGDGSGALVRSIIETGLTGTFSGSAFLHEGGWTDGWAGLHATVDLARADGDRVLALSRADGQTPLLDTDIYRVAGCVRPDDVSGTLCAYTGFSATTPFVNPATQSPWTNVDLLVDALSTNEMPALVDGIVTDSNATPLWPVGEYFQPLEILPDRLFSDDFALLSG